VKNQLEMIARHAVDQAAASKAYLAAHWQLYIQTGSTAAVP